MRSSVCKRIRFGGTTSRGLAGIDPLGQRLTLRLAALICTASALHRAISSLGLVVTGFTSNFLMR